MPAPVRPRRSALYLPAINAKALAKARTLPVDMVILDLEDAVAPEQKAAARDAAVAAVREGGFGRRELIVRVNGLDTEWGADDLTAVAAAGPDGVLAPKVAGPDDVAACHRALAAAPPETALWSMIETCAAIGALFPIAAASAQTRPGGFVMGTNDLAKEMRAALTPGRAPFQAMLGLTVAAARAHGLAVLDGVSNDFRDLDAFRAEAEQGLAFGFDGKTLIHPAQVDPCNEIFSPTPDALAWADRVIAAFAAAENAGKGVVQVDGRMVELLHHEQAVQLRAMADMIAAG